MEIAVADAADHRTGRSGRPRGYPRRRRRLPNCRCDIGTQTSVTTAVAPGQQRKAGAMGAVAYLPAQRDPRGAGPVKAGAAEFQFAKTLRVPPQQGGRAVELDHQMRAFVQMRAGILVEGARRVAIDDDPRHRDAGLDGGGDTFDRPSSGQNRRRRRRRPGRLAQAQSVSSVMMPSVPSEPTKSPVRS